MIFAIDTTVTDFPQAQGDIGDHLEVEITQIVALSDVPRTVLGGDRDGGRDGIRDGGGDGNGAELVVPVCCCADASTDESGEPVAVELGKLVCLFVCGRAGGGESGVEGEWHRRRDRRKDGR